MQQDLQYRIDRNLPIYGKAAVVKPKIRSMCNVLNCRETASFSCNGVVKYLNFSCCYKVWVGCGKQMCPKHAYKLPGNKNQSVCQHTIDDMATKIIPCDQKYQNKETLQRAILYGTPSLICFSFILYFMILTWIKE